MEISSRLVKIIKINWVRNFNVSCMFSDGLSRKIDFQKFLGTKKNKRKDHPVNRILSNHEEFEKVKIIGNSLGWEDIGINSTDENGKDLFLPLHLDPDVLLQNSEVDENENFNLGYFIKSERKRAGLTQEKLAKRIGSNKAYISKIENNNANIEFLTFYKIIKAGFRKEFSIRLESQHKSPVDQQEIDRETSSGTKKPSIKKKGG